MIHTVFAYLRVSSSQKALAFYEKAFGATEKFRLTEPSGRIGHMEIDIGGTTLMISDEFPEHGMLGPHAGDGAPVSLHALGGQPMVVNLWATWCPPCRREMPTLQQAQQDNPAVTFVFANQGEAAETITAYLQQQPLQLDNVLVDSFSALSEAVGSRGLPTTLFFDAEGRLLDSHVGELSAASLAARMQRFEASSRP